MAFSDTIARLAVSLSMDTAAFTTSADKAGKKLKTSERDFESFGNRMTALGKKLSAAFAVIGGAAVAGQLAAVAKRAIDSTAEIGRLAQAAGVSASAFQELNYAATQVGIGSDQMADGLKELNLKLGEAATGSKSALAAFENYGVSIRDSNGEVKNAAEILPDVAEAFTKLKSPAEQAAFAAALFGEDVGPRMVPLLAQGRRGIDEYRAAAQELGIVLSDAAIAKAAEAQKKMAALNLVLEAKIAGAVTDNADAILELADALGKLVEYAGRAAKAWRYFSNLDWSPGAPSFSKQMEAMQQRDLGPGVQLTDSVKQAIAQRDAARFIPPAGGSLIAPRQANPNPWLRDVPSLLQKNKALGSSLFGGTDLSSFAPGSGSAGWMMAANDNLTNLSKLAGEIAAKNKEAWDALAQMGTVAAPRLATAISAITPQMEALRAATQGIFDRLYPDEAESRRFREEQQILAAALKAGQINAEDYARAMNDLRQEYNGFGALIAGTEITSLTGGTDLDELNSKILDQLPTALGVFKDSARETGTQVAQSFEEMARNAIGSLNAISGALQASSLGGLLADIIGGKTGRIIGGLFDLGVSFLGGGFPKFANGTNFAPGGLSWVGERGPELVDLPRGARVTPNNDIGRLGGGDTYNFSGNLLTPEWWAQIQAGNVQAARAGAQGGVARIQYAQSRRWR